MTLHERIKLIRSTERRIKPDAAWVRSTRATLLMQVKNTLPTASATRREGVREIFRHFVGVKVGSLIRTPVLAFISLVAVLTGGSVMSVSAAERSLPGDFFYTLKIATEQARLALTSAKDEKLKLKTTFTERRVKELKQVIVERNDGEHAKEVAEVLKRDLKTMTEQLGDVKDSATPAQVSEVAKLVDQKTTEVMNALQETKGLASEDTKAKVTEAQSAAAETGVKALEVLVENRIDSQNTISDLEITQALQQHAQTVAAIAESTRLGLVSASSSDVMTTSSTSSTITVLAQAIANHASSTDATTTTELPSLMSQVKDLTQQAFALPAPGTPIPTSTTPVVMPEKTSSSTAPVRTASSTTSNSSSTILSAPTQVVTPPPR